jgi:magnesium and cobalt exporter, CNNM family
LRRPAQPLIQIMSTELVVAGALLVVLVFLSIIDSAFESLSDVSLRVMLTELEDSPRAQFFRELLQHPRRFALILILGTQLSIAAIAILVTHVLIDSGVSLASLISFVIVLIVILLFRQFIPRVIAQNNPEAVLWALLPIFRLFYQMFSVPVSPIIRLLDRMKRPDPEPQAEGDPDEETKEEIQAFLDVGEAEGIIEESEGELIQSIIEFKDTLVGEIMTPRLQIVVIEATATVAEARMLIIESKRSRIPVYRDQIDNIEGIVYVRDLLAFCEGDKVSTPVTSCTRPAYFVPESKSVRALLEEMQKAKVQISIVIDEYGGVAGLVTIEDIIEEILGEIADEDEASVTEDEIVHQSDGSYLVDGAAEIKKVELLYERDVEADDFTTVAGLLINELGHVPEVGEKLTVKGLEFEVVDSDGQRVNRVRLRALEGDAAEPLQHPAAREQG